MKENTNIFERITQLVELKGIKNIPDLAVLLGYDNPEKLYRLKRKPDAKPSFEMVEDFSNKFEDLNIRWFITGEGEPIQENRISYAVTPAASGHLHDPNGEYQSRTPDAISGVTGVKAAPPTAPPTTEYGVNAVYLTPKIITVDNNGNENILHVSIKAAAGYLEGHADPSYLQTLPSFNIPGLNDATYRSFEVEGDSMHPTLKHGQMVIGKWVEKLDYIREDRVYIVVRKHGKPIIKRLLNRISTRKKIVCKSDATDDRQMYKTFEIDPDEVKELWYAVFHGGFDFQSPSDLWKRVNNNEADLVALQDTVNKLANVIKTAGLLNE